jgi:hypothetical protein
VTLSAFKFANQQLALDKPTADTTDPQNKNSNVKDFLLSVGCVKLILRQSPKNPESTQAGSRDFRRPEAYEQMAADKPGPELSHDAAIWKLYLEEADEHDQELVKGRDASLDMLLLFVRFSCFPSRKWWQADLIFQALRMPIRLRMVIRRTQLLEGLATHHPNWSGGAPFYM